MANVNKCFIVGNVGTIGDLKNFPSGGSLLNISVATSNTIKSKSGQGKATEITEWHRIVLVNHLANYGYRNLRKGCKVYIEGALRTRKWTESGGANRSTTEIYATVIEILSCLSADKPKTNTAPASDYEYLPCDEGDNQSYPNFDGYDEYMQGEDTEYRQT